MGAAYKAKLLCTNTFYAKRDPASVLNEDLSGLERYIDTTIDFSGRKVTAHFPGIPKRQAIYMKNIGCIALAGMEEAKLRKIAQDWNDPNWTQTDLNPIDSIWRLSNQPTQGFDPQKLRAAINREFSEPVEEKPRRTRAVLIVHEGRLIAERYAPGISGDTPLQGWSATKSVINALVGILVKQGKLSLDRKKLIPEWSGRGDPRSEITLDQMLRMSSGLEFDETAGALVTDLTKMLLRERDVSAYALAKPLLHPPNTHWYYSSGTTNIISSIIRKAAGGTAHLITLMQNELFKPLGINRAIIEPDATGNLIGSSFMYATAREWAAFGQLYLQDGEWNGRRILPEGWVQYSATPTLTAAKGQYGAHFWTNGRSKSKQEDRPFPKLPGDLFYAAGYKGQRVIIVPLYKLVIVRLGWGDDYTMEPLVADILAAKSILQDDHR